MVDPKLEKAMKLNPHLKEYLDSYYKKNRKMPKFVESLSRDFYTPEGFDYLYPVGDPIFIHVFGSNREGFYYNAIEPRLSPVEERKKKKLLEIMFIKAGYEPAYKTREEFDALLDKLIKESTVIISEGEKEPPKGSFASMKKVFITRKELKKIKYYIKRDILENGILEPLLRDNYIEDIHCIGLENIFVIHKVFKTLETNIRFRSLKEAEEYLRGMSERIGKPVSMARPIIDSALPDGSRLNLIFADDISVKGPSFTIRKFTGEPLSVTQLIKWGTMSAEVAAYLWLALENGMSIFVCGETASGKTTTLNAILPFIRYNAKIYSVEDTAEVLPPHRIWQQLLTRETGPEESRVDYFTLLKAALRSRPNYIIAGEIRGKEGAVAFQAMQTGHPVIATFHAADVVKMIQRFTGDPINVPIRFMDNLNIALFQQAVYRRGKVFRRVVSLSEILGYSKELGGVLTKQVFVWEPTTDRHRFRGRNNSYILENKIALMQGLPDKRQIYREMDLRAEILNKMVEHGILAHRDVVKVIWDFQRYGVESLPFAVETKV
ncbi:MAG: Flp pilus assembly complex ATPase component TadA [Thermoplasmata archaeon]|nr:Flp pilus assembly complex ATPase component TadA [Thermoplasmata archaeon]